MILQSERTEVVVAPERGGRLTAFRSHLPTGVKRWFDEIEAAGCFPMVPFFGRIDRGVLDWRGKRYQIAPNFPPEPHAIHGLGWQSEWSVDYTDTRSVVMSHHGSPSAWPWPYLAQQRVELCGDVLQVTLQVENCGSTAMPIGIGLHPHFDDARSASVDAMVYRRWELDARGMPMALVRDEDCHALYRGLDLSQTVVDSVFSGWDGRARICWRDATQLSIRAHGVFDQLTIYRPEHGNFFCVEPVSHTVNAFNLAPRGDSGTRVILPGQRVCGALRLSPLLHPLGQARC